MPPTYKAAPCERLAQRFIYPLFVKDGIGGYDFSSTVTFIKYRHEYFCVFAAHALPTREDSIENIGVLRTDGEFMPLSTVTKKFRISRDSDLVICNTIGCFDRKNYFELDSNFSSTEFKYDCFYWIGFPIKKAVQKYHKTKSSKEHIVKELTPLEDGFLKWNNAEFLLIEIESESKTNLEITGRFVNKNVTYKHEGFKQNGYALKGMSGGALFYAPKKVSNVSSPNDLFCFAGIGLKYAGNLAQGASRRLIMSLIDEVISMK